jgi:hypothetical protein
VENNAKEIILNMFKVGLLQRAQAKEIVPRREMLGMLAQSLVNKEMKKLKRAYCREDNGLVLNI